MGLSSRYLAEVDRPRAERLEAALDELPILLGGFDRNLRLEWLNAPFAQELSRPAGEIVGLSFRELCPAPAVQAILERVCDRGRPHRAWAAPFPCGSPRRGPACRWDWWARRLTDPAGRVDGLLVGLQDAAAGGPPAGRPRLPGSEPAAEDATGERFLSLVAHELRNPMTAILAGIEILRRAPVDSGRAQRTLGIIDRSARLQARLVSELLDVSRLIQGRVPLARSPLALAPLVTQAAESRRREAAAAGLGLTVEIDADPQVEGDPARLHELVGELVANAIKFTRSPGQLRVRTAVRPAGAGEDGPRARIEVHDSGIGLAPEILERIFELGFRAAPGAGGWPGLGIGLARVRAVAGLHGGRVWAESPGPGCGSLFVVELPVCL